MTAHRIHRGAKRLIVLAGAALCAGPATLVVIDHGAARAASARTASAQGCGEPFPATRDPSNPLVLPTPPGPDPLTGASFFVPGPAKGAAAGAIARLLGLDPQSMPIDESWASFSAQLASGRLRDKLLANPDLAHRVSELSKIASQPEAQRFSSYSWGGTPNGIFKQAQKVFCQNMLADPGTVPIVNTYFLHASLGGCPTPAQVRSYTPLFRRRIDAMAAATGRRPVVYLLELDAIGSSGCVRKMGSLPGWEADLRYEIDTIRSLPHTVVYVEAGYSDANPVNYTARVLNAIGVRKIRGFFTNDTHEAWTSAEDRWASAIARKTHGAHFIVDTADNGRGPKLNRNRVKHGNEDLCNPPGRGLGPSDTTVTGFAYADAYLWTHPPGNSSGHCNGGPSGGVFWPARAIGEAERANNQLGPTYPSQPY